MKIEIDQKSGFCFGVVRAINRVEELLSAENEETTACGRESEAPAPDAVPREVFCLGDIVHNRVEVNRLESLGMRTVTLEDIPRLTGRVMLIRAHGEPPATYRAAQQAGVQVVDATCPVVAHLQRTVVEAFEKMEAVGGQVVILGKKGHPEVVGLSGQVDERVVIVESVEDIDQIDFSRPIYLLSQTTQSLELFETVSELIRTRRPDATIHDTICRQVSNRNPHLREFAARFDAVVFVSGKKSSNGKALFGVCRSVNPNTYFVEDEHELRAEWFEGVQSVGICGATSTPRWIMEGVARRLEQF